MVKGTFQKRKKKKNEPNEPQNNRYDQRETVTGLLGSVFRTRGIPVGYETRLRRVGGTKREPVLTTEYKIFRQTVLEFLLYNFVVQW